jgi:serine/threonine-protein kinase HipA
MSGAESRLIMPSETTPDTAYVWAWLPGATKPVVAGVLRTVGDLVVFRYAASYQENPEAVALYLPELPLGNEVIEPIDSLEIAGCITDGAPDSWGQRVIIRRLHGRWNRDVDVLDPLTCLLESGSDRFGALDFQSSPTDYVPRSSAGTLEELTEATERVEAGESFSPELEQALFAGSSLGGARPKAVVNDNWQQLIAKFSKVDDPYPVVKAEGIAMNLARHVGIDVAGTKVIECLGKDVLLVDRFDRNQVRGERRMTVSALTIFGLSPMTGRYATYYDLAEVVRARFTDAQLSLREIFSRIVLNVCVGNTDDHARNHAAFWDPKTELLKLTPAYDICPQLRSGGEATQTMAIHPGEGGNLSRLATCVEAAEIYQLTRAEARELIDRQLDVIRTQWNAAADEVRLSKSERDGLWGRQILNPFCLEGFRAHAA